MHVDVSALLATGTGAVLTAAAVLTLLLRSDLATAGSGRIVLGGALGLGVIVFTLKLIILTVLMTFPGQTIAPLIRGAAALPVPPPNLPIEDRREVRRPEAWRPLPATAPAPPENPTTPAKVALGERLFNDRALSLDGTLSCASCHDLLFKAGADGRPVAPGVGGALGARNVPTVWNAAFQSRLFWDGRALSLEEQASGPLLNPEEMAMPSAAAVEDRVKVDDRYAAAFSAAFGDPTITMERITAALAAFERTLITPDTPYDRFVGGETTALTGEQQRGMWLFREAGCQACHAGPNFSGASLIGQRTPFQMLLSRRSPAAAPFRLSEDTGRAPEGSPAGLWRIPSLRNVALTAPYFHNGAVDALEDAVRIMAESQLNALVLDDHAARPLPQVQWTRDEGRYAAGGRLVLDQRDIKALAAFLRGLSSPRLVAAAGG